MPTSPSTLNGFNKENFKTFMGFFDDKSPEYQAQMAYFWKWLKGHLGRAKELTYSDFHSDKPITETLTLVDIRPHSSYGLVIGYKTKTGKQTWFEGIVGSCYYRHFERRNKEAGKWVEPK